MERLKYSCYGKTGAFEGCEGADPIDVTAGGGRQVVDIPQPSACGDKTSKLEALCHDLRERLVQVEKEVNKNRVWSGSVDTRLQFLESCYRSHAAFNHYKMQETSNPDPSYQEEHRSYHTAFPGWVTQKELQEKEEYRKLQERVEDLEARNKELLSKAISMHKDSENMNDSSRLSAVLQMYDMLRLHEWQKLRGSITSCLSYKTGSNMIKKLFDACEKDIQQRITNLFEVLGIPPPDDDMTNTKQGMMIRNLLRHSYDENCSEFYSKIAMQSGIDPKTILLKEFTVQCCKIYCLLLLQDQPVKAVWYLQESLMPYLEHVDKKDREHWRKVAFLWPVMKCGEQVIVKGVVWD